jgi:hypothetical protein
MQAAYHKMHSDFGARGLDMKAVESMRPWYFGVDSPGQMPWPKMYAQVRVCVYVCLFVWMYYFCMYVWGPVNVVVFLITPVCTFDLVRRKAFQYLCLCKHGKMTNMCVCAAKCHLI